ncbi:hypothetical protein V5O48_014957, partial [Marasmius crinis-equi]
MSNYFQNARDFTLNNPNLSSVGGNQYVYNYHSTTTVTTTQSKSRLWIQGTEEEEGEFDQYHEIKRADVELVRSVCSSMHLSWPRGKGKGTIYEQKVFIAHALNGIGQGSSVTVVGYEGPGARE